MRSVGEVEFVQGLSRPRAPAASLGRHGGGRWDRGQRQPHAGDAAVEPVLEALLGGQRQSLQGHPFLLRLGCKSGGRVASSLTRPGCCWTPASGKGFACLQRAGSQLRRPGIPHPVERAGRSGRRLPGHHHHPEPRWPSPGRRALRRQGGTRCLPTWQQGIAAVARRGERGGQAGWVRQPDQRVRLAPTRPRASRFSGEVAETVGPWLTYCIEQFGPPTLHVREQTFRWTRHPTPTPPSGTPSRLVSREFSEIGKVRHVPGDRRCGHTGCRIGRIGSESLTVSYGPSHPA